ncbi:hypothetical protein F8M41_011601 [Gigaspora margarita]|uniref:F-box domain-containing protein n=1 Tax=Gigaspora margarita TaxID=4874 RepID=A0A8H3WZ69_GIGMA|nr:hypothetical protein F8M41_011601 [Gigaspora margarita]
MPELMEKILNNLNNEFNSLRSCALVSRHWCKMSIPMLWQDPFSFEQNPFFISIYFSSLGEDEKFILKEYGINAEFSKTLFDYARFLKVLDLSCLTSLYFPKYLELKSEIFNLFEQNTQFFSQVQELVLGKISLGFRIESATKLLRTLAKNVTKISALKLDRFASDYKQQLFHALICIINSQEQLKEFSLVNEKYLSLFYDIISDSEIQNSAEFEILKDCKTLEILRIKYCDMKLLKIFNSKISTLEIVCLQIDASNIVQILENSCIFLQRFKLETEELFEESLLLESLESFCPNITYLNISKIGFSTQLIELIGNLQKLQFLTLSCTDDSIDFNDSTDTLEEELKIRAMHFAELLPSTLQYLDLRGTWLNQNMDISPNHCNSPFKKLLIGCLDDENSSKALIEFCIRIRTLNYVGVLDYLDLNDNIKKDVEAHVVLVPYERIVVDC